MKTNHITSSSNSLLKKIRSLHERHARQKTGLFLIEGEKLIEEALARGLELEAVVVEENHYDYIAEALVSAFTRSGITLCVVPAQLFAQLMTTHTSCHILAVARAELARLESVLAAGAKTVIWGENIQDPGNLGTMMRSALAFGADCLLLTSSVDVFNPKVVRSAMGALFELPVAVAPLAQAARLLGDNGFCIAAFSPEAKESVVSHHFADKCALLIGNEGQGLSDEAEKLAAVSLRLPQKTAVESLNAAVAASIALYERFKQSEALK